jgi:hypothetical protein
MKALDQFYTYRSSKQSSRCKACQCNTARRTGRDRRRALRLLIAMHADEYRAFLRSQRISQDNDESGGDGDVA